MRSAGAAHIAPLVLLLLCGSAAAQTAAPKTFVEIDGHKLHVRLSGAATLGPRARSHGARRFRGASRRGLMLIQNGRRLPGPKKR